jgi:hypothetical protein
VSDCHHQNNKPVVFDHGDDAIVGDAVSQTLQIAGKRLAKPARVLACGNPFAEIAEDCAFGCRAKLAQIARRFGVKLDTPDRRWAHPASTCLLETALEFFQRHAP